MQRQFGNQILLKRKSHNFSSKSKIRRFIEKGFTKWNADFLSYLFRWKPNAIIRPNNWNNSKNNVWTKNVDENKKNSTIGENVVSTIWWAVFFKFDVKMNWKKFVWKKNDQEKHVTRERCVSLGNSEATVRPGKRRRRMERCWETSLSTIFTKSQRTTRRTRQITETFDGRRNKNQRTNSRKLFEFRTDSRSITSSANSCSNGDHSSEPKSNLALVRISIRFVFDRLQEELKISRLVFALVKDRLIDQFEESYSNRSKILEVKIRELEASKRSIEDAINNVDNEKRRLKGDDNFEKQFPREFADVPTALQDALKRLLARRARFV